MSRAFRGKNVTFIYRCIAIIHFKRSHIENKFRQLDKFTFNLSIFFNQMFSLQSPFSNWIVNIRLSIIYLVYACRVQSVAPPLVYIPNSYVLFLVLVTWCNKSVCSVLESDLTNTQVLVKQIQGSIDYMYFSQELGYTLWFSLFRRKNGLYQNL